MVDGAFPVRSVLDRHQHELTVNHEQETTQPLKG